MAAAICEVLCGKERVTKHILLIIGIMFLTGGLFFSQNVFAAVTGLKSLKYSECMTVVSDDFFFTETVEDRVRHEDKTGDNYAAGELLVFYKQHISHLEAESDAAAYGAELIGYIGSAKICQWYFGDEYSLNELQDKAQKAEKNRNIRSAGLNYIFYDEPCVSGYFYDGEKSGLNGDQEGVMRIQEARKLFMDEVERRGSVFPVNVGIYDTAFYSNHEDLKFEGLFYNFTEDVFNVKIKEQFDKRKSNTFWDKVWPIKDIIEGINDSRFDVTDTVKQFLHGTHVAGILGAINNNGIGIDGVYPLAYEKSSGKSHLYGFSSLGMQYINTAERVQNLVDIIEGLEIFFLNDVKIINYSMGVYDESEARKKQVEEVAIYLQGKLDENKDFLIIASSGNDAREDCVLNSVFTGIKKSSYPDIYDRIIVVGNCTVDQERYSTSNAGDRVDLWAVGEDIYSTGQKRGVEYLAMTGTSQSVPYVTGTAAMIWTLSPGLKGDEVKKTMIDTSNGSGLKILDAESAVRKAIESGGWSDEMEISVPGINVREILTNYYRTNLIPRYGKVPERMEILLSEWKASDLEGLIGYEVYDFDKDGQDEMAVLRLKHDPNVGIQNLNCVLEMYEVNEDRQVLLQDYLILEKGTKLNLSRYPNMQIGLFRHSFDGKVYLIWGLDAYDDIGTLRQGSEHVYRAGILTYNDLNFEEKKKYGLGQWPEDLVGKNGNKTDPDPFPNIGLANYMTPFITRVKNDIIIDGDEVRTVSGFSTHFYEEFHVLPKYVNDKEKVPEEPQPIAELNISLRTPVIGEEAKMDITIWPEDEENVDLTELDIPKTPRDAFMKWLESNAKYQDIIATDDMFSVPESGEWPQSPSWNEDDLYGYLSMDIRDYDRDGVEEMLLTWFAAVPGMYSQTDINVVMEMYEYDPKNHGVEQQDIMSGCVKMMLLDENLYRPEQINIFTYDGGEHQILSVDLWESMNDTVTVLSDYYYDGSDFHWLNGLSYEQYGEGNYIIREALCNPAEYQEEDYSIWTGLYYEDVWKTSYEWYTEDHDYELIEKAELEHFRSCHKELANGLGLTATEEFRSGFMAITDFNEPQDPRRDCSAVDVYTTPNDSLIPLASILLFNDPTMGNSQYVLHRRDWQGSLDTWRIG